MRWVHTSDIHGEEVSLSLKGIMQADVLSDGGDCLQGSAWTAFAKHKCAMNHLVAEEMNAMQYDVMTLGNHDIEQYGDSLSRFIRACRFPVLCANADIEGSVPYTIVEKGDVRIAVVGLVTAAVKYWVDSVQRCGCVPDDVAESARKWVERIRNTECVDAVFALIHSGWEGGTVGENVVRQVASEVCGIDVILYGHDHHAAIHKVTNCNGKEVLCVGTGCLGLTAAVLEISRENGLTVDAHIVPCPKVTDNRESRYPEYATWIASPVCRLTKEIDERDSFFGPSSFLALFHDMQFAVTQAELSLTSPMNFDSCFARGRMSMRDLFRLCRFNTKLYVLKMKGESVRQLLEWSYSLWANTMRSAEDEALLLDYVLDNGTRKSLKNISLNMLSAAGIDYEVDLREPVGSRVRIQGMNNGESFDADREYRVAVNSYHGTMMLSRWECVVERVWEDYRDCLQSYLQSLGTYEPHVINNWYFTPKEWTRAALKRDRVTLFSRE